MDTEIKIPAALASECGGARKVTVHTGPEPDLAALLDALAADYPRLGRRLRDEAGQLRRYVNIFLDDEECRRVGGLTAPTTGRIVQILPSIAGG
ncbi:MoaD/ThiS family protein [Glycomyces buryatensis]|uniref:MoaD/ThiS family protein n=1 Tax=Glycomyces buryatensis TaxID=2570927 RepID=A0A4S8PU90_9ACTN|nr:MoaD/ThiS family protein [Glycomyces buryatensis]THV33435.1 MoaD/ThiS family protein [Glycomyces buryatensis]